MESWEKPCAKQSGYTIVVLQIFSQGWQVCYFEYYIQILLTIIITILQEQLILATTSKKKFLLLYLYLLHKTSYDTKGYVHPPAKSSKQLHIVQHRATQSQTEQSRPYVASHDCVTYPYRISSRPNSRQSDVIIQFPAAPPEPPSVKISIYFLHSKQCCALIGNSM